MYRDENKGARFRFGEAVLGLILAALLFAGMAVPIALASDAEYLTVVTITNNSTATSNVFVPFTLSTAEMINGDMLAVTADDCTIKTASGDDCTFMPGYSSNPWLTYVASIGDYSQRNQYLYSGGVTGGKIRYFPADTGMTTPYDASLALGNVFTFEAAGCFDASAVGNILEIEDAFVISGDGSGNITADIFPDFPFYIEQDVSDAQINMYSGSTVRVAQRINAFPVGTITQVSFHLAKYGSPTGTAYIRVRKVSDDSILGTVSEKDVSTLTTNATWYDFNASSVTVDSEQDIRITAEYSAGGDSSNFVYISFQTTDVTEYGYYSTFIASWSDNSARDLRYKLTTDITPLATVSATGVDSDEHTVTVAMDSPFYGIGIDATDNITPVTDGLVLNTPLWQTDCDADPFTSIDSYELNCDVSEAVWSSSGYEFDGANDHISVAHDSSQLLTTGGTIEAWIKPDTIGGGSTGRIVDKSTGYGQGTNGYAFFTAATNRISFQINGGTQKNSATNSVVFGDGNLYHALATWDATGYVVIYINGVPSGAPGISADPAGITTTNVLRLGNLSADPVRGFDGLIGEVRIYNRALTPDEIEQNYNATKGKYGYEVDHELYSTLASVPDNGNDIVSFQNGVMPYVEYQEITVGGELRQYVEWEYGLVFHDTSDYENDVTTVTFRTTSSNEYVSAAVSSQGPVATQGSPSTSTPGGWTMIEDTPEEPAGLYDEGGIDFPGGAELQTLADDARLPVEFFTFPLAIGTSVGAGLLTLAASHKTKVGAKGSLFIMLVVSMVVWIYWIIASDGVIPAWSIIPYVAVGILLLLWRNPYSQIS